MLGETEGKIHLEGSYQNASREFGLERSDELDADIFVAAFRRIQGRRYPSWFAPLKISTAEEDISILGLTTTADSHTFGYQHCLL